MIIDFQNLKLDLDKGTISIDDKILNMKDANAICTAYLCMSTFAFLLNNYMDELRKICGEDGGEEKIFEIATRIRVVMIKNNIDIIEAIDMVFTEINRNSME